MTSRTKGFFLDRLQEFLDTEPLAPTTAADYGATLRFLGEWLDAEGLTFDDLNPTQFHRFLKTRRWNNRSHRRGLCAVKRYARFVAGASHPIIPMRIVREAAKAGRALDSDGIAQLLCFISKQGEPRSIRDMALIRLLLDCGLRASEVCKLNVTDINLNTNTLSVIQKGGSLRWSTFSQGTADWLHRWLVLREKYARCDALFVGLRGGKRHTRHGIKEIMRKLGHGSGLGLISPHYFRRTACCEALRNGAPMDIIAKQMGWSSTRMVEHYVQRVTVEAYRDYLPKYE